VSIAKSRHWEQAKPVLYSTHEEDKMETQGISKTELKQLMKEAMISVLTERKDLLEDAVSEAILDMKLGLAMEEGDRGEYVPESEVLSKLMG